LPALEENVMGLIKEFREFAVKGNVIDMAVGIIIGAAFTGVVTSLVNDVVMPPIGVLVKGVDFSSYGVVLKPAEGETPAVMLAYGKFINALINFTIVAFVVFLLVKQINRLKRAAPPPAPNTKECPYCASAIAIKAVRCPNCTSQLEAT